MNLRKQIILGGFAAIVFGGALMVSNRAVAQEQDVEVLTRGPVHEAFAGTVSYNPEPGIRVTVQVPEPIEEMPPEQRLEGDNVAWIPGYWAWDEEQNDFLWISGIWRNLPPGRQWVPGYWSDVDGGYQWTSGYWEDAETTEVNYLPEPPKSLEVGPNIEAPSNDQSWIPGNWMWSDSRYAWRAGYWSPARENWIWIPGHYRWTHRGYVYVDGYWDYAVARRGVLFAPVHFNRHVYASPGYFYSPATVISLLVFSNHLFLRPNYCHYYFGDYYAPRYRDNGFYASYSYSSGRRGYDPIYSHYRWENRNVRNWDNQRRDYYEYRRDHSDARPPRTFAALNSLSKDQLKRTADYGVAEPLSAYVSTRGDSRDRFKKVSTKDRQRIVSQTQEVRKYGQERKKLETRSDTTAASRTTASAPVVRAKANRSPIVATVNERSDKSVAPPKRLEKRSYGKTPGTAKAAPADTKVRPTRETQVMPTEKTARTDRQPAPTTPSDKSGKTRQPVEPQTQKVAPERKRQTVAPPVDQGSTKSTKSVPRPATQTKPDMKRQTVPSPTRQVAPAPKRAEPAPVKRAEPKPATQVQPSRRSTPEPSRKATPVQPQRQETQRAPQRPAPQPQRQETNARRKDRLRNPSAKRLNARRKDRPHNPSAKRPNVRRKDRLRNPSAKRPNVRRKDRLRSNNALLHRSKNPVPLRGPQPQVTTTRSAASPSDEIPPAPADEDRSAPPLNAALPVLACKVRDYGELRSSPDMKSPTPRNLALRIAPLLAKTTLTRRPTRALRE